MHPVFSQVYFKDIALYSFTHFSQSKASHKPFLCFHLSQYQSDPLLVSATHQMPRVNNGPKFLSNVIKWNFFDWNRGYPDT